jgi:hypothetical protein
MTLFHSIETDLDLVDAKLFGDFFSNQRAIGKEDRSEGMVSQYVIDLPKMRMEQRFPSRNEEPQSLDLFKFFQNPLNLFFRKILMVTFSDITVAALEIASIRDLKFKIAERGGRGGIQSYHSLERGFGEGDQFFGETESDKFLILFPERRMDALADLEEKSIGIHVQFIKFVFFDVVEIGFFEVFQNGVRGQDDEFILEGHRKSLQG